MLSAELYELYLEPYDGKLRMVALGKGLGLGLSQYGANELAKDGKSYKNILKYYYTGIKLQKCLISE